MVTKKREGGILATISVDVEEGGGGGLLWLLSTSGEGEATCDGEENNMEKKLFYSLL